MAPGSAVGNGAGGSVNIITGTLAGAGTIHANGGFGSSVAGGGGRVAITYGQGIVFEPTQIEARGGSGAYGTASGAGSIVVQQELQNLSVLSGVRNMMLSAPSTAESEAAAWELYH